MRAGLALVAVSVAAPAASPNGHGGPRETVETAVAGCVVGWGFDRLS